MSSARQAACLLCGRHATGLGVLTTKQIEISADMSQISVGVDGDRGEERSSPVAFGWVSMGSPDALRSFDPLRIAELEYRMWVAYYLRRWRNLLVASVSLFWLESVTRLYCYLFGETAAVVRPAAAHRVRAMDLSDQWVREGCRTDSPLLPLVRAYAALLAAVHHEER